MTRTADSSTPAPLLVAASLVAVEAFVLLVLAVMELAALDTRHPQVAITVAVSFLVFAGGMTWCAWSITRGKSWARSPIVLAQLIGLGVAWSFRSDPTTLVAIGLAVVAAVILAGVLHPASIKHLDEQPSA